MLDGKDSVWIKQAPGEHKAIDVVSYGSVDHAIHAIGSWSVGVGEELMARGRNRVSVDEIIETIDAYINEKVSEPDVRFGSVEIDELNSRLSSLEARFKELLDKSEISKPEYNQVKKSIDAATQDVGVYTKRIWYKTSMTKVLSAVKSIVVLKEGRELLSSAAKKLLGLD